MDKITKYFKPEFKVLDSISRKQIYAIAVTIIICLALFFVIAKHVDGGNVSGIEKDLFIFINSMPNWLNPLFMLVQYLGILLVPVGVAILFLIFKRPLTALLLLAVPILKINAERIIKADFARERPAVYIENAILRGDVQASGLSFVSGHIVIVAMMAIIITPFVPKRIRYVVWALVALVMIARVYLGAHLPLDVVGGLLVGLSIGLSLMLITIAVRKIYLKLAS